MIHPNTTDIKHYFIDALANEEFVTDRTEQNKPCKNNSSIKAFKFKR